MVRQSLVLPGDTEEKQWYHLPPDKNNLSKEYDANPGEIGVKGTTAVSEFQQEMFLEEVEDATTGWRYCNIVAKTKAIKDLGGIKYFFRYVNNM